MKPALTLQPLAPNFSIASGEVRPLAYRPEPGNFYLEKADGYRDTFEIDPRVIATVDPSLTDRVVAHMARSGLVKLNKTSLLFYRPGYRSGTEDLNVGAYFYTTGIALEPATKYVVKSTGETVLPFGMTIALYNRIGSHSDKVRTYEADQVERVSYEKEVFSQKLEQAHFSSEELVTILSLLESGLASFSMKEAFQDYPLGEKLTLENVSQLPRASWLEAYLANYERQFNAVMEAFLMFAGLLREDVSSTVLKEASVIMKRVLQKYQQDKTEILMTFRKIAETTKFVYDGLDSNQDNASVKKNLLFMMQSFRLVDYDPYDRDTRVTQIYGTEDLYIPTLSLTTFGRVFGVPQLLFSYRRMQKLRQINYRYLTRTELEQKTKERFLSLDGKDKNYCIYDDQENLDEAWTEAMNYRPKLYALVEAALEAIKD